jgi:transcriptional regulator of nitric oxide reductase
MRAAAAVILSAAKYLSAWREILRSLRFLRMTVAVVALLLGGAPLLAQEPPPKKLAKSIDRVFGTHARVDTIAVGDARVLRVARGDSLLGFAQVRNVIGRDQPITYLVAIDPSSHLLDIDILVYREPYGGEVAYDAWRKQFRGKGSDAPLAVGQDIRNISGATISSHKVTASVHQALAELTEWRRRGTLK